MNLTIRKLFLIDGIGAVVSAFLLGVVLVKFEDYIGMPRNVLYPLALVACVFAVYSFSCYWRIKKGGGFFYLKLIAFANLTYIIATMGLVVYYFPQLSTLGVLYFILEAIIVVGLVSIEWRKSNSIH